MHNTKHPEAFVRTLLTIRLRSSWSVSPDVKFIRITAEENSVHILKADVTGYGLDEPEDRTCVFILTRGALYRLFTGSNTDAPLLLRRIHDTMGMITRSTKAMLAEGNPALAEED